eukprot:GHRQ01024846.1.p5 GENE.GHRQ01024846.1~~GHRQ01024846.1.p5  ORF type:complete len:103 (-),score=20.66 GHRQ01024846.1:866-1174(-)
MNPVPQAESTMAVQSLKPRIEMMKARYGDDQAKIKRETNFLYEQAGVNPLAGEARVAARLQEARRMPVREQPLVPSFAQLRLSGWLLRMTQQARQRRLQRHA